MTGDKAAPADHVGPTGADKVQESTRVDAKPGVAAPTTHKTPATECKEQDEPSETRENKTHADMRDSTGTVTLGGISKETVHYHKLNGCRQQIRYPRENDQIHDRKDVSEDEEDEEEESHEIHLTPVCSEQERPFLSQSSDGNRMSVSSDTELPPLNFHSLAERTNPSISEEDEVYPPTPPCRTDSLSEASDSASVARAADAATASAAVSQDASGLTYDSVKYTLVVDEHAQLELVSLKHCYQGYDSDSDNTVYESAVEEDDAEDEDDESGARSMNRDTSGLSTDSATDTASDAPRSRKFVNLFVNRCSRFPGG